MNIGLPNEVNNYLVFFLLFGCSNLPIIQAAGVINTALVVPSPTITIATGSGILQQPPMGFDNTATPRLFSNRTDDSDDDYDI